MQDGLGATGEPFRAVGAKDDEVGLLADFKRPNTVGHPDGSGGINGVQGQGVDGAHDGRVHMAIADEASKKCGIANGVDGVASVFRVASKRHTHATLQHVVMTASSGDSLSESQVSPRTYGDCGVGFNNTINFVVVQVHCMCEQHVIA